MKAVVIGNGPSLNFHNKVGDFELLKEVDTFAMNNIFDFFEPNEEHGLLGTDWRPSYWTWVEYAGGTELPEMYPVIKRSILPYAKMVFINDEFKHVMERANIDFPGKVNWVTRCSESGVADCDTGDWHLPMFCNYGGTVNLVLSLVYMMGYRDVAVIGCDLGIKKPVNGRDTNHFRNDYITYIDGDYTLQDDILRNVHGIAKRYFPRIVNCGIGGELEVYPRMKLREWMNDNTI